MGLSYITRNCLSERMNERGRRNLHQFMLAFVALPMVFYGIVRLLFELI